MNSKQYIQLIEACEKLINDINPDTLQFLPEFDTLRKLSIKYEKMAEEMILYPKYADHGDKYTKPFFSVKKDIERIANEINIEVFFNFIETKRLKYRDFMIFKTQSIDPSIKIDITKIIVV